MLKHLTAFILSILAYMGTFTILASTVMYDDWRVFFVSMLPIAIVFWLVYGREEEGK